MDSQVTIITDELITYLADINERLLNISLNGLTSDDKELAATYRRSFERLQKKRLTLLVSLRDAINNEIGEE